ncbi:hypothetical protein E8P82_12255 [Arthrobacter echini]|uniref:Uncharacterized protein n=1 Tax=Arthrobacter echini TaxID=1529066 RepID=A0A4S5E2D4_9MICC|nr:hypothetical protein [Arthrobacter echini]THJ65510.1 hypothetical protein E8P82_12255 [Arthrobacter echini]
MDTSPDDPVRSSGTAAAAAAAARPPAPGRPVSDGYAADPPETSDQSSSFTPRWGRVGIAFVGLLALVIAFLSLLLVPFGIVSPLVPLAFLVVSVASVAVLRWLVLRSRSARVDAAFAAAMAPTYAPGPEEAAPPFASSGSHRDTVLFDAEDTGAQPLTATELRTAALAVAHGSSVVQVREGIDGQEDAGDRADGNDAGSDDAGSDDAGDSDDGTGTEADDGAGGLRGSAGSTAWVPVEVPLPLYVAAPKANRAAPSPLDLPQARRASSSTPIKAAEAAARRTDRDDPAVGIRVEEAQTGPESAAEDPAPREPAGKDPARSGSPDSGPAERPDPGRKQGRGAPEGESHERLDLDDVLQRRRA